MTAAGRLRSTLLAGAALALAAAVMPAEAKTLVYCSEGAPENFNPMLNTTGTTFDANRPIYNRLIEFKHGSTDLEPGLAESWGRLPGWQGVHLPPAPWREVAQQCAVQADARLQRR